jgi:hypothetical protein
LVTESNSNFWSQNLRSFRLAQYPWYIGLSCQLIWTLISLLAYTGAP